jgi:predicted DNA-binding transcriptional regulator AlpA
VNQQTHGGGGICQNTSGTEPIRPAASPSPAPSASRPALLTAAQAAREVYGVSERTFHDMRARGIVPPAILLGPRLLRWSRADLEAATAAMPRQDRLPEPSQLLRRRVERMKATGIPTSSSVAAIGDTQ